MRIGFLLALMLLSIVLPSAAFADEATDKSCKTYVQGFYDWYWKQCRGTHNEDPSMAVFKNKNFAFSPELYSKLKEDDDVAKLFPGEIVGLDIDPFLNAQDIAQKYTAGKVSSAGAKYHVEVFGTWEGKKSNKPDVIPELVFEKGNWTFVNFIYPGADSARNNDLLSVLAQLKKDRPPLPKVKAKAKAK